MVMQQVVTAPPSPPGARLELRISEPPITRLPRHDLPSSRAVRREVIGATLLVVGFLILVGTMTHSEIVVLYVVPALGLLFLSWGILARQVGPLIPAGIFGGFGWGSPGGTGDDRKDARGRVRRVDRARAGAWMPGDCAVDPMVYVLRSILAVHSRRDIANNWHLYRDRGGSAPPTRCFRHLSLVGGGGADGSF
jgi:hypothetical protein